MAGFRLGNDYSKHNFTLVDNEFLMGCLPHADGTDIKIYLYGLALGSSGGFQGTLGDLAVKLKITPERVQEGFAYWEKEGILHVSSVEPLDIVYHSVKAALPKKALTNLKKYQEFQDDMVQLFPDKFIVPNDVVPFMELLQESGMEPTAMLQIVQYCIRLKGEDVSTPYMLAVANNWIKDGIKTERMVSDRIEYMEAATEELREVLLALGVKSHATLEDREAYQKWRKIGFTHEGILAAAKLAKRSGGTARLDKIIRNLKNANAYTPVEIDRYRKEQEFNRELQAQIIKNIGGYYASLDAAVETYLLPWLQKGFSEEGLLLLSRLAFRRNIKTLEGLDTLVQKFFKLGIVSEDGINAYVDRLVKTDEAIKQLLEAAGAPRYVSNRDRDFYRVWLADWKVSDRLILEAAKLSAGHAYPMSYMNALLLGAKETGKISPLSNKKQIAPTPLPQHDYTKEELAAIFTDISDIDNIEV